jgi:hypothetical protein
MRIGFYLLAGAMLGGPAILANPAADAHPRHHHGLHAAHFIRPDVSLPPASHVAPAGASKLEDHRAADTDNAFTKGGRNAEHAGQPGPAKIGAEGAPGGIKDPSTGGPTKELPPPDVHMKDLGPVDTRISVEPRLHGVKPDRVRNAKTKFKAVPGRGLQGYRRVAPTTVVRNAIGVPIHRPRADNEESQKKIPGQIGAGATLKPHAGNASTNVVGLGLRPQVPNSLTTNGPSPPSPTIAMINHSSISGSIMLRPSITPGVIGGPAKNIVGLNGTTFRQRHP